METGLKVKDALNWIKAIIDKEAIPYQIVGGFAARAYGAKRPINDIDMYIPMESVEKILPYVEDFISKPLKHYVEELWDVQYFQLKYREQKIEVGLSPGGKFYDKTDEIWIDQTIDFSSSFKGQMYGIDILIMPRNDLIEYKRRLGREVDIIDIAEMEAAG